MASEKEWISLIWLGHRIEHAGDLHWRLVAIDWMSDTALTRMPIDAVWWSLSSPALGGSRAETRSLPRDAFGHGLVRPGDHGHVTVSGRMKLVWPGATATFETSPIIPLVSAMLTDSSPICEPIRFIACSSDGVVLRPAPTADRPVRYRRYGRFSRCLRGRVQHRQRAMLA
jgi:hypothetical protein